MSAVNQQERSKIESWIVGFTDGEGCFSVSFIRNATNRSGWQIFPEFVITQGEKSLPALRIFKRYFKCGRIFVNKRYDNHNENLYRFCVRRLNELATIIVPFFKRHKLQTAKAKDFVIFSRIIKLMVANKHLAPAGMDQIANLVQNMNRKKKSRFLESSETIRRTSPKRGRYSPTSVATQRGK
jgi:hypothetical protein